MASFSIGEVEKIIGIKAHVLRYWESVIPAIKPQKDIGNRRTYSNKNVQILMRLKHLIQVEKYTIEGARNRLIEDLSFPATDDGKLAEQTEIYIQEIRGELLDSLSILHKHTNKDLL